VHDIVKREEVGSHSRAGTDLVGRLDALKEHYNEQFKVLFDAIRDLTVPPDEPPDEPPKRIGFRLPQ
jgi:hypothetical protein